MAKMEVRKIHLSKASSFHFLFPIFLHGLKVIIDLANVVERSKIPDKLLQLRVSYV